MAARAGLATALGPGDPPAADLDRQAMIDTELAELHTLIANTTG